MTVHGPNAEREAPIPPGIGEGDPLERAGAAEPCSTASPDSSPIRGAIRSRDALLAWIKTRLTEVQHGDGARARLAFEGDDWRTAVCLGGVPGRALERVRSFMEIAEDALGQGVILDETAIAALISATRILSSVGDGKGGGQ